MHRSWLLDTDCTLPADVLSHPVTSDGHNPAFWWTVKDHFAHCSTLPLEAVRRLRRALGEEVPIDELEVDMVLTPLEQLGAAIDRFTHRLYLEHRDKSVSELVAVGERVLVEQLSVLASIPDDRLDEPLPGMPDVYGNFANMLLGPTLHDRVLWQWVLEALVRQARGEDRHPDHLIRPGQA